MRKKLLIPDLSAKNYFKGWAIVLFFAFLLIAFFIGAYFYRVDRFITGLGILLVKGELTQVISPLDATLDSWLVEEGDLLSVDQNIARLRSYESSHDLLNIFSPKKGLLAEIIAYPGTQIKKGDSLALITPYGDARKHLELIGFVSSLEGQKIRVGMKAELWPSVSNAHEDGALLASVKQVGKLPMAKAAIQSIIKIPGLAKYIRNNIQAEPFLVVLALEIDESHKSGYGWSKKGPSFELDSGIITNFRIIYATPRLIDILTGGL